MDKKIEVKEIEDEVYISVEVIKHGKNKVE